MQNLIDANQLSTFLGNEEFILKTQQQIAKDFATFNLIFPDNFENIAYSKESIESLISEQLAEIMKEGETRLLQLLYTIDISEKQFLGITTEHNFIQLLAEKILFREAYKVFLRAKYS
jgi:hypothetical protein